MIDRKYPERTVYYRRSANSALYNTWGTWLYQRQIGCPPPVLGFKDRQQKDVYSAIRRVHAWDQSNSNHPNHGGVFNLEFSPDGRILIGACEKKSILVFDALNGRPIDHIRHAHNDCVNCVRFLDSRVFATCSDDMTVALWDVRYLKHRIRSLRGHSNWVKNIEYASNSRLLVTSGFDGSIYTWDINRYTEDVKFRRVFHTDGLMRTKLTPDESKLILCTTGGYLMIVNNLNLSSLASDLGTFNPNMYRLMQLSNTPVPNGCNSNHVFTAKYNRVELISDFPDGNDAEVISSLQIHPQGWCALSRNTSSDNNSEWTCIHDIQDLNHEDVNGLDDEHADDRNAPCSSASGNCSQTTPPLDQSSQTEENPETRNRPVFHIRFNYRDQDQLVNNGDATGDGASNSSSIQVQLASPDILQMLNSTYERVELNRNELSSLLPQPAPSSSRSNNDGGDDEIDQYVDNHGGSSPERSEAGGGGANETEDEDEEEDFVASNINRLRRQGIQLDFAGEQPAMFIHAIAQLANRTMVLLRPPKHPPNDTENGAPPNSSCSMKIHQNANRLTHYMEELNVKRGFIKELCFSTDGRLVCSPFGNGIRLLGFDAECRELCDVPIHKPQTLHEITTIISHKNVVVSTKFSPTHSLLVSGCLNGQICFHQPLLQ